MCRHPNRGYGPPTMPTKAGLGLPLMEQITPSSLLAWFGQRAGLTPSAPPTARSAACIETPGFYQFRGADDGVRFLYPDGAVLTRGLIPDRPNGVRGRSGRLWGEHPIRRLLPVGWRQRTGVLSGRRRAAGSACAPSRPCCRAQVLKSPGTAEGCATGMKILYTRMKRNTDCNYSANDRNNH